MSGKRLAVALGSLLTAAALVLGVASGAFAAVARSALYATGLWLPNAPSTLPPGAFDPENRATPRTPSPSPSATVSAGPSLSLPPAVLAVARSTEPDAAKVRTLIRAVKVKGMGQGYSGAVLNLTSGKLLYDHRAATAYIPASTNKLLTSTAALSLLGPEHTFRTSVVAPGRGRLILVGGGDPYLAKRTVAGRYPKRASIPELAAKTAAVLQQRKIKQVRVDFDTSLFRGPAWNPTWLSGYTDQVTPTSALWVDEGRVDGGSPGARVSDPPRAATTAFAAALARHGITAAVGSSKRAPSAASPIASVASMPLERIVEKLLMESDNDAAEVLFRQAALAAGEPGSIQGARTAVPAQLAKLGIWDRSARIHDGSGLSRSTKVPARTLVDLLHAAATANHPELRAVLTGLPVAGVEGSLRNKFDDAESLPGRGRVRGKTGTLREVHSLAGFVQARDGSLLGYAFLVNKPKSDYASVVWLSHVTAALSECGCRS